MDILISLAVVLCVAWVLGNLFDGVGKFLIVTRLRKRIFLIVLSAALFTTGITLINVSALSVANFVQLNAFGPLSFIVVLCFVLSIVSYLNSKLYR